MAGVAVVHRDVQGEVVRIEPELVEFVGGDQQVQRQLLVAEVEADHLRQEFLAVPAQRQLDQALFVEGVVQVVASGSSACCAISLR